MTAMRIFEKSQLPTMATLEKFHGLRFRQCNEIQR